MKKLNLNFIIFTFILLVLASRVFAAYFFADIRLDNEWGKLVHNLDFSGILGINVIVDEFKALHKFADPGDTVLPSVFMPPLYAYFIYYVKLISNNLFDLIKIVIFVQIFLSLISVYIFFKILRNFENFNVSLLTTIIFSFFPLYVYSSVQISSVSLQIFLLLSFFYYLLVFIRRKNFLSLIYFSIFSGFFILFNHFKLFFYIH